MLKQGLVALGLCLLAQPAWAAGCAPTSLVKAVSHLATPGLPENAFARKPKTVYRQGATRLRLEESEDVDQGLHLLTVINEPDVWQVNLADNTAKHFVDRAPQQRTTAGVIGGGPGMPAKFGELEYGCEAAFARTYGQKSDERRSLGGRLVDTYVVAEGPQRLELFMDPAGAPVRITYQVGRQILAVVDYDSYEASLPDQPQLFAQPTGLNYVEAQ
jgi:hypothetical protein